VKERASESKSNRCALSLMVYHNQSYIYYRPHTYHSHHNKRNLFSNDGMMVNYRHKIILIRTNTMNVLLVVAVVISIRKPVSVVKIKSFVENFGKNKIIRGEF